MAALDDPRLALDWSLAEWEVVVRSARRLRLLARLAAALAKADLLDRVPEPPRRHLVSEQTLSAWRTTSLAWAARRVAETLGSCGQPRVLLKGAAYLAQGLPIAAGRLPSDLDILVPREQIAEVQGRLSSDGWAELAMDDHDRRYYHEWSHEVPPMRHPMHRIELDLHHNILPPVARTRVDAERLLERVVTSGWPGWTVLQPVDQVLHSAAHLFLDAEVRDRVRDLVDLDGLLRHFGADPLFWDALPERSRDLGLQEPLALAVVFCRDWLGTPVPAVALCDILDAGPSAWRRAWLLPLLRSVLAPTHPDDRPALGQRAAATVLLAHYHRNRMPLRLLVPHLWHKWRTASGTAEAAMPTGEVGR